jgi:hypothetical protein
MIRRWFLSCSILMIAFPVRAQETPEELVKVVIRPAAAPVPALKYQLLPDVRDQIPGNAVIYYGRAAQVAGKRLQFGPDEEPSKWLEMPAKDWPLEKVRSFVQAEQIVFRQLELAARCHHCDWQLREEMRKDALGLLMPEVQKPREFANLLRLRAGLEILDGRFVDAVHTLGIGFTMAKHVAQSNTMIGVLVGVAVAGQMADQAIDLFQASGAPNLYWALTDLPRPFIELRTALQSERFLAYSLIPPLTEAGLDIRTTPLSVQQLQERLEQAMGTPPYQRTEFRLFLIAVTAKSYPEAKQFLLTQGLKPEIVEAMPRLQVVFLFSLAEYDRLFDEIAKWQSLPYWQASKGLQKAMEAVREDRVKAGELERIPLASYLIPAVQRVFFATTQLDRKLAALRCMEAIRLYAAGHDGKLPAALREITEVPIPVDPLTGKDFDYTMEENKATLSAPPPAGEKARHGNYLKYELTLAK